MNCPKCQKEMTQKEGRLSQCSRTYLPATVSQCLDCDIKRWDAVPSTDPNGRNWKGLGDTEFIL